MTFLGQIALKLQSMNDLPGPLTFMIKISYPNPPSYMVQMDLITYLQPYTILKYSLWPSVWTNTP